MFQDPQTFANRSEKGPDQMILQKYVWKSWGKTSSVQHGNKEFNMSNLNSRNSLVHFDQRCNTLSVAMPFTMETIIDPGLGPSK